MSPIWSLMLRYLSDGWHPTPSTLLANFVRFHYIYWWHAFILSGGKTSRGKLIPVSTFKRHIVNNRVASYQGGPRSCLFLSLCGYHGCKARFGKNHLLIWVLPRLIFGLRFESVFHLLSSSGWRNVDNCATEALQVCLWMVEGFRV